MKDEIFRLLESDACHALESNDLLAAANAIEGMLTAISSWGDMQELHDIRQSYATMLEYLREGSDDPQRTQMREDFMRRLILITERTRRSYNHAAYHQSDKNDTVDDIIAPDCSLEERYKRVASSGQWSQDDMELILTYITTGSTQPGEAPLMVSAVMMALLDYFDPNKMLLLCHLSHSPERPLRVRAQVGLVLVYLVKCRIIQYYPHILAEVRALVEDPETGSDFFDLQLALFSALNTPNATRDIEKRMDELTRDIDNKDKALKGLKGMFHMVISAQEFGADLNYPSFQGMMRMCGDFFDDDAHWFLPFMRNLPELADITIPEALNNIFKLNRHSDTDKYAFVLILRGHKLEIKGMVDSEDNIHPIPTELLESEEEEQDYLRYYVYDVYRFFTIHREQNDDVNPFRQNVVLKKHDIFASLFNGETRTATLTKWLIHSRYHDDAISILEGMLRDKPNSPSLLRKLAYCYDQIDDYETACDYMSMAQFNAPDDIDLQKKYAEYLIRAGKESEATPILYEITFKHPDDIRTLRNLAWCLLKNGEVIEADKLYATITASSEAIANDYLNYGHALLLQGQLPMALDCYKRSLPPQSSNINIYNYLFVSDASWLKSRGITTGTMRMIVDALQ